MKFTKEEISLCKQVAEKHRKEIEYGDWYEFGGKIYLITVKHEPEMHDICIPLWTISDCLKFLREKGVSFVLDSSPITTTANYKFLISYKDKTGSFIEINFLGNTPLEACLKAVLAVVEEG